MNIPFIRCFVVLSGIAIMSSCSRPTAYFQPTVHEHFAAQSPTNVAMSEQPTIESAHELLLPAEHKSSPGKPTAQAKQMISQLEAYVRNDAKLVSNRKLAKRLLRINEVLNVSTKPALLSSQVRVTKTTFMERTLLKKINKKVKQHLAPDQSKTRTSNIMLGIILALVGLLLLIIASGFFNTVGIIALIVGVGLVALTYLGYIKSRAE